MAVMLYDTCVSKPPLLWSVSLPYPPQDEIESVVLVGGGTRVPRVQDELQKTVKKYI